MSLYSALYAGVSGLGAQASAMATVADNITNVNTIGYKGVSAQFQTLVTDGRARSNYSAGGVAATPKALISKQGLLQASSSLTDIGIDGSGFFVVRAGTGDEVAFTRAGSFTPDAQGYLRNASGYYLQGWPLDADGNYVDNGNLNTLQTIRPNALTGSAMPTSKISLRANLQSTAEPITGAYVPGSMASGALSPQFSRSVDVYDAQGTSHRLTFNFVKTAANEWVAEISGNPADITSVGGTPVTNGLLASGTVKFNPDGSLDLAGSDPALFATFQNPDGLTRIGGNAYMMSQDSGNFAINKPGALGAGTIAAGKLEASNVDLAQEFSNMILFQRAYSASSKIITTVDDMLQEVSNLKR